MRQIIPKKICELQDKFAPYMIYVEGEGVVLAPDAPPEIVSIKIEVDEWFDKHKNE